MDTFQMNPKTICADMAFHHPHDMQAFYRMHNVKRIPTGPHTPWSQGSNGEKYTGDLEWQNAHGIGHETKTKRSPGPSFHESRTAYIHANQAGPLNEEIQKLAMKTHLEVQQREDIRPDLAERMKFVPPDHRAGEQVFYWQEDPSKIQQQTEIWQMVEGGNHCSQGPHG